MASDRPSWFRLNPGSPLAQGLAFAGLGQLPGLLSYQDASPQHANGTLTGYTGAGNTPADRWGWDSTLRRPALAGVGSDDVTPGDRVAIPTFAGGTTHSAAIWLRGATRSGYTDQGFVLFGGASGNYLFWVDSQGQSGVYYNAGGTYVSVPYTYTPGTLVHYAVTRRGTTVKFYINGRQQGTTQTLGSNPSGPTVSAIAAYASGTYGASGSWADAMLWTRDLAGGEVAALADPSNVDLRFGGVPLIQPARRLRPVVAAGPPPSTAALFRRFHSLRTGSRGVI